MAAGTTDVLCALHTLTDGSIKPAITILPLSTLLVLTDMQRCKLSAEATSVCCHRPGCIIVMSWSHLGQITSIGGVADAFINKI